MMDPITIAAGILSATGLGDWIKGKLGGALGEKTAQKVIELAQVATGSTTPAEIEARLKQDAELANQLRNKLLDYEQEELRLIYADRSDARKMQTAALGQDDVFSKRFIYYFAIAWSAFAMLYVASITFVPIPAENIRFADTVLGFVLGTIVATIIAFFFGSAHSNRLKDSSIADLVSTIKSR